MLDQYLSQTEALLLNPPDYSNNLYSASDLTAYINTGRGQLAVESECIRATVALSLTNGTQSYSFSSATSLPTGANAVLSVRMIGTVISSVHSILEARPWEWLYQYYIAGGAAESSGTPKRWAQQGQGTLGTIFFDPIPNATIACELDAVLTPSALVNDSSTELIPYPWTDAVPYYAAYLAYNSAQRPAEADRMLGLYKEFALRAREGSTPTVLPENYQGGPGARMAANRQLLTSPLSTMPRASVGG